jgi:hypothetical protein
VAISCGGRDAHLACIRELDGVAHEIEQRLGKELLQLCILILECLEPLGGASTKART